MGIMWRRLVLQRLKSQLQSTTVASVNSQSQAVSLAKSDLQPWLEAGRCNLSRLNAASSLGHTGVEMFGGSCSQKKIATDLSELRKRLLRALQRPEVPGLPQAALAGGGGISRNLADIIRQSPSGSISATTRGLHHCIRQTLPIRSATTRTLSPNSLTQRISALTLSHKPSSTPSHTLSFAPLARQFHQSSRLRFSDRPSPSGAQNSGSSSSAQPSASAKSLGGAARQRLASESVRKASAASKNMLLYLCAMTVAMVGATYSAVPLYRMFCQVGELRCKIRLVMWIMRLRKSRQS